MGYIPHSEKDRLLLEERLVVLKRLSGLRSARFSVVVGENDEVFIEQMVSSRQEFAAENDSQEAPVSEDHSLLKIGDRVFRVPELSQTGGDPQGYFG